MTKSSLISQERFQEMAFSGNGLVEEWIGAMREEVGDGDGDLLKNDLCYWSLCKTDLDGWCDLALAVRFFFFSSFSSNRINITQLVCLKWQTMSPCVFKSSSGELLTAYYSLKWEWCRSGVRMTGANKSTACMHAHAHTRFFFVLFFLFPPDLNTTKCSVFTRQCRNRNNRKIQMVKKVWQRQ